MKRKPRIRLAILGGLWVIEIGHGLNAEQFVESSLEVALKRAPALQMSWESRNLVNA